MFVFAVGCEIAVRSERKLIEGPSPTVSESPGVERGILAGVDATECLWHSSRSG